MKVLQNIFNIFPAFRGKLRLANAIFSKVNVRNFCTPKGIFYTVPNLTETIAMELFVNGIYEKETVEFICNSIPRNGSFIDVGANIGALCIEVAVARPDVRVYAFEASPSVYSYLKINQAQNCVSNLFIYNLAVHEQNDIELPFYSPPLTNGKGSFSPVFTDVAELVRTVRLDKFIIDNNILPDFIKVDVEGYELLVFRSLSNFLHLDNTILLFEFVDWAEELANFGKGAAQDYLIERGYFLTSLSTGKEVKSSLRNGMDMLIARKK